jgi:phospholipid/cholesterol/gamma-HCH transport system substrate-binding protein
MSWNPLRTSVVLTCVAAVVIAAGVTLGSGEAKAASRSGYCAILPDTIGLYVGNEVTRMGYAIGEITSITPFDSGVRVEFSLHSDRSLPADVKAVTRSKSILADRSLELVGESGRGTLEPGDCVSIRNAYTPKSISEITGSAADLIDQIAPEGDTRSVAGSIDQMSTAVAGTGPSVANLMSTASAAAESPDRWISDIGSIIQTMAPLSGDALTRWKDIASIITKLPAATDTGAKVLWPGAVHMIYGMTPVLQAIGDFVPRYGREFFALLDVLPVPIHIAATRVGDITRALDMLPAVANTATLVTRKGKGAGMQVSAPQIRFRSAGSTEMCTRLNAMRQGSCRSSGNDARTVRVSALDLLMAGAR